MNVFESLYLDTMKEKTNPEEIKKEIKLHSDVINSLLQITPQTEQIKRELNRAITMEHYLKKILDALRHSQKEKYATDD